MIKAVLFDFGGVLTENGTRGFVTNTIARLYGLDIDGLNFGGVFYLLRRGRGDEYAFFQGLNRRYNKQVTIDTYVEKIKESVILAKDVYTLAETIRDQKVKTGILSNIFPIDATLAQEQGWYDGFSPV